MALVPPTGPQAPIGIPAGGGGVMDQLKQILPMLPALLASAGGNKDALGAFMQGYQKTMAQMEGQGRERDELNMRIADRDQVMARQAEQDTIAGQERDYEKYRDSLSALRTLIPESSSVEEAEGVSQSVLGAVPVSVREQLAPMVDAQLRQMPATITGRQRGDVERLLAVWEKSDRKREIDAAGMDPFKIVVKLPPHLVQTMGKPEASLGELQEFARLPVGVPKGADRNPTEASLAMEAAGGDAKKAFEMLNRQRPSQTDPEVAALRKELLQLQVDRAKEPQPTKEPNQAQFTSAAYAGRMEQAEPILTKVATGIVGMSLPAFEMQTNSWFAKPTFQSDAVQSYMQASRNFINAVLRRESGAVISPQEFAEARQQYLPVAGDTPDTLAQKAANRQYVFQTMKRSSGDAYEPPVTLPALKERRMFNGVMGEWNGKEWVEVKP